MVHKLEITDGGGSVRDGGIWHVRETDKTFVFQKMTSTFDSPHLDRIVCRKDNRGPHALRDWGDGTYTVYPDRKGTPHYVAPVDKLLDSPAHGATIAGTDN